MGIVKFWIVFDRPGKTYSPGEMVTGRVELKLDAEKKIRGVELEFEGKGKSKWSETETYTNSEGKSNSRTVWYQEYETYIKKKQILIGGKNSFKLPPGEHIYPFAVMLPPNAPSSYSGTYGGVSYNAKANIDIPFGFDKTRTSDFNVINLLNLNLYPNLRKPHKYDKHKTFCCLWCKSGPLTVVVLLPKIGFAASESIPITLEIDNASNVEVDAVHVYLERKIHWKANNHAKYEDFKLEKLSFNRVKEGQSRTWSENFRIPNTAFPYLGSCSIINISHELHIEAVTSGFHFDLDMHIPITIGHIPLNEDPIMPHNPGMQPVTPGTMPTNQIPLAHPYQGNPPGALFGVPPSQICPSAPPDYADVVYGMKDPLNVDPHPGNPPGALFGVPSSQIHLSAPPDYADVGYGMKDPPNVDPHPGKPPGALFGVPSSQIHLSAPPGQIEPPNHFISKQQYPSQQPPGFSSIPPQPAINPEYSQNASHPLVSYASPIDGFTLPSLGNHAELTLPSIDTNVKIQNTSFLDAFKDQKGENTSDTTQLLTSFR